MIKRIFLKDNRFFYPAKTSKYIPHLALSSLLLPMLFVIVGLLPFEIILTPLILGDPVVVSPFIQQIFNLSAPFIGIVITLMIWLRFVERRSLISIGLSDVRAIKNYFRGLFWGIAFVSIAVGIMALWGVVELTDIAETLVINSSVLPVILLFFCYLIQSGSEEILIRGWQFQVIGARYKPWIGLLISSLFFSVMHIFNYGASILAITNLFMFSILLVLFCMKDESIWKACGFHATWNWAQSCIYGLNVSGSSFDINPLIILEKSGPDYLTGGQFGLEGSISASVVLLIGIVIWIYIITRNLSLSST